LSFVSIDLIFFFDFLFLPFTLLRHRINPVIGKLAQNKEIKKANIFC